MKILASILLIAMAMAAKALQPGDVIINEVRFNPRGSDLAVFEAVEVLVVADKVNLNGLHITDRNFWDKESEEQCTINDMAQGFLTNVRSGTLVTIYAGKGQDDIDPNDFTLTFYVNSSIFCNAAPTGKAFSLYNHGDNIHLLHKRRQIDFVKYATPERSDGPCGDPGSLKWESGARGFIDISPEPKAGFRFIADSIELNDYPAAWRTYIGAEDDNLGKPNGGRNTEWINLLRAKTLYDQSASSDKPLPAERP